MSDNNTVLVATDGSDHSLRILPHASVLANQIGAALELVRVLERGDIRPEAGEDPADARARRAGELEPELAGALAQAGVQGKSHVIEAMGREGAAEALLRVAGEGTLMAIHSRGRGSIARVLHGSVAVSVLQQATQPLMLGGPELLPPPAAHDAYHLLVTTDLSPDADNALRAIAPLFEMGQFQVTLLFVHLHAPFGIDNEAERAQHEATLAEKRALLPAGVAVESVVREIPIGAGIDTAIMEVATESGAQAIAMSTHGHSARHHLIMGSVALSILGRSRLPLIVVRARD